MHRNAKIRCALWRCSIHVVEINILLIIICTTHRVKMYREHAGHMNVFFRGDPVRYVLVKSDSPVAPGCNDQHALYVI